MVTPHTICGVQPQVTTISRQGIAPSSPCAASSGDRSEKCNGDICPTLRWCDAPAIGLTSRSQKRRPVATSLARAGSLQCGGTTVSVCRSRADQIAGVVNARPRRDDIVEHRSGFCWPTYGVTSLCRPPMIVVENLPTDRYATTLLDGVQLPPGDGANPTIRRMASGVSPAARNSRSPVAPVALDSLCPLASRIRW